MPMAELRLQNALPFPRGFHSHRLHIGIHHDGHKLTESDLRLPIQLLSGFCRIDHQTLDLQGTQVAWRYLDVLLPIHAGVTKGFGDEFADRMSLSRAYDVVIRIWLLQHQPDRFYVLGGVTPIPDCIEIAQIKVFLLPRGDAGQPLSDLSRDKSFSPPRTLMVE